MQLIDRSFSENYHILECWEMDTRHLCRMRVECGLDDLTYNLFTFSFPHLVVMCSCFTVPSFVGMIAATTQTQYILNCMS